MKILLDECLPLDFRHSLPTHDAHTAQWAGEELAFGNVTFECRHLRRRRLA